MLYLNLNQFLLGVFYMPLIELSAKMKSKELLLKGLTYKWVQKHHLTIILECE